MESTRNHRSMLFTWRVVRKVFLSRIFSSSFPCEPNERVLTEWSGTVRSTVSRHVSRQMLLFQFNRWVLVVVAVVVLRLLLLVQR